MFNSLWWHTTARGKFIAYYRVSTERQGKSGLGLDAQRTAVMGYLNGGGWRLLGEFTEVETGKGRNALVAGRSLGLPWRPAGSRKRLS